MSEHEEITERFNTIEALLHKIIRDKGIKDPSDVLTVAMVTEQYKCSKATVFNWINRGLKSHKKNGRRFYRRDVDKYLIGEK